MVGQQRSLPSSLLGSCRNSVTSLNNLDFDLETRGLDALAFQGRSLSMVDMKRDAISLCSVSELDEGVSEKKISFFTAFQILRYFQQMLFLKERTPTNDRNGSSESLFAEKLKNMNDYFSSVLDALSSSAMDREKRKSLKTMKSLPIKSVIPEN